MLVNEEALKVDAMFSAGYSLSDVMEETNLSYIEVKRLKQDGSFEFIQMKQRLAELEAEKKTGIARHSQALETRRDENADMKEERDGYKAKIDRFQEKGCAAPQCPKCNGHLLDLFITPQGKVVLACDTCEYRDFKGVSLKKRCNRTYFDKQIEEHNEEIAANGGEYY